MSHTRGPGYDAASADASVRGRAARAAVATALTLSLALVGSPAAAALPTATLELRRDAGTLWAEADVSEGDATTVKIKFYAPRRNDPNRREVWQVCRLPYRGAGLYRCGIDVSRGSLARDRRGTWVVKVLIDGTRVAKQRFSL